VTSEHSRVLIHFELSRASSWAGCPCHVFKLTRYSRAVDLVSRSSIAKKKDPRNTRRGVRLVSCDFVDRSCSSNRKAKPTHCPSRWKLRAETKFSTRRQNTESLDHHVARSEFSRPKCLGPQSRETPHCRRVRTTRRGSPRYRRRTGERQRLRGH